MSLPPLATIEDLNNRMGTDLADDDPRALSLLSYASALVRRHTGCTFVNADGELLDTQAVFDVRDVVVGMVERVADNPAGVTQEVTGPFSVSFGSNAAERIYLSAGDKVILGDISCRSPLRTIQTTRGPVEMPSPPCAASALPDASDIV
jgi:hypothetical protein